MNILWQNYSYKMNGCYNDKWYGIVYSTDHNYYDKYK